MERLLVTDARRGATARSPVAPRRGRGRERQGCRRSDGARLECGRVGVAEQSCWRRTATGMRPAAGRRSLWLCRGGPPQRRGAAARAGRPREREGRSRALHRHGRGPPRHREAAAGEGRRRERQGRVRRDAAPRGRAGASCPTPRTARRASTCTSRIPGATEKLVAAARRLDALAGEGAQRRAAARAPRPGRRGFARCAASLSADPMESM